MKENLIALVDRVDRWQELLRDRHLSAGFVNEDWLAENCSVADIAEHREFLKHYRKALLSGGERSEIVYSDAVVSGNDYINELKRQRFVKYGPVSTIYADPSRRHLAELSKVAAFLAQTSELISDSDVQNTAQRLDAVSFRLRDSLQAFHARVDEIADNLSGATDGPDIHSILHIFRRSVSNVALDEVEVMLQSEAAPALRVSLNQERDLLLVPILIRHRTDRLSHSPRGRLFVHYAVSARRATGELLDIDDSCFIDIPQLIPFEPYTAFDSAKSLALCVVAHSELFAIVVPDIVQELGRRSESADS